MLQPDILMQFRSETMPRPSSYLILLALLFSAATVRSQTATTITTPETSADSLSREFLHFPRELNTWSYRSAIGLALTILPRVVAEEELRQVPMLDYQCRYTLPWNFALNGRVSSNVFTNLAMLGAQWNGAIGRVAAGAGYSVAFWYGFAQFDGFNIDARGWITTPSISAGIELDEMYVSARAEMQFITNRSTATEGIETSSDRNELGGYALGFDIEQPFWGRTSSIISMKLNYSRSMYQSWLAFSTFREYLVYPEFSFMIIL